MKTVKSEVREWLDRKYEKNPGLRRRVEELLAEMELEQDLVALREERGLSQSQVARILGVSQPAIAKIESGRTKNLELRTLVGYATALGARLRIEFLRDSAPKVVGLRRAAKA